MDAPDQNERVRDYVGMVSAAAWRFRNAAEYDDLYQEGMIAVWKCPIDSEPEYVSQAIYNRLKDWARFVKRQRHFQSVSYEEVMDELHETDD